MEDHYNSYNSRTYGSIVTDKQRPVYTLLQDTFVYRYR